MSDNKFIKIIGVGNGGCNIVNNMFKEGNLDVSYTVCNTDKKALKDSPVPDKLFLESCNDETNDRVTRIQEITRNNKELFQQLFNDEPHMAFITAGMGGGTGTCVAPIIARISKERGVLTIGVITTPFFFEGEKKISLAYGGVVEMSKYVDALLVINNEQTRKSAPDTFILDTISKADETLKIAVDSISEIISYQGLVNLDFEDLKQIMTNGGPIVIYTGYGDGEHRINEAIENALNSQQFKHVDLFRAKKIILKISIPDDDEHALMIEEMIALNDSMDRFGNIEIKWGLSTSPILKDKIMVTILATGFRIEDVVNKIIYENEINHNLQPVANPLNDNKVFISYKRTDKDQVFYLKDLIEDKIGNHCWIDLEGIESDAQFANVIINAINQADVFLFMYSSSHAQRHIHLEGMITSKSIKFEHEKEKSIPTIILMIQVG